MVVRSPLWKPRSGDEIQLVNSHAPNSDPGEASKNTSSGAMQEAYKYQGSRSPNVELTRIAVSNVVRENQEPTQQGPISSQSSASHTDTPTLLVRHDARMLPYRFSPSRNMMDFTERKVHGVCALPPGYELALLPSGCHVNDINSQHQQEPPHEVTSSYNFSKGLVAIFQTVYASFTLYRTRGDQLQRYGYASFGLTVAPYLVMSIVNLTSTVLTPDYPAVYMVRSTIMDEASRRGGYFEGVIGSVECDNDRNRETFNLSFRVEDSGRTTVRLTNILHYTFLPPPLNHPSIITEEGMEVKVSDHRPFNHLEKIKKFELIIWSSPPLKIGGDPDMQLTGYFISSLAIAIVGGLSRFRPGHRTKAQRVWTMTWLAFGIFFGPITQALNS